MDILQRKLQKLLEFYNIKAETAYWEDGRKMIEQTDFTEVDVLFLDIDLPHMTGIEIAEIVKKTSPDINLIFLTNREDLVFHAIHFHPYRFIRKSRMEEELGETVDRLLEKISNESLLYQFGNGDNTIKIPIRNIQYLESSGHNLIIYHNDGTKKIRGRISEYEKRLEEYGFFRVHSGFLVNVRYVYSVKTTGVTMDDGTQIPISRGKVSEVKKIHMAYMRKHIYGNN